MRVLLACFVTLIACRSQADAVIAAKTLRAHDVISADSVALQDDDVPGAAKSLQTVIGQEVVAAVYAGRPIMEKNLVTPALVERNEIVRATFQLNGLIIEIEARALERGTSGDVIRAMNLASRTTIQAEVQDDGQLKVLP